MNIKSLNKPLKSNQRVNRFEYPIIENLDFLVISQRVVHSKVPYFAFNFNEPPSNLLNHFFQTNQSTNKSDDLYISHKPPSNQSIIYLTFVYALLLPLVPFGSAFNYYINLLNYLAVGGFMITCGLLLAKKKLSVSHGGTYEFRNL